MAYRPSSVIVTYGPHILKGFAEGDFVTVDQDGDTADVVKGAGGQSSIIVRDADQVATCEVTVFADSVDNRILTQIYAAQRAPGPAYGHGSEHARGGDLGACGDRQDPDARPFDRRRPDARLDVQGRHESRPASVAPNG